MKRQSSQTAGRSRRRRQGVLPVSGLELAGPVPQGAVPTETPLAPEMQTTRLAGIQRGVRTAAGPKARVRLLNLTGRSQTLDFRSWTATVRPGESVECSLFEYKLARVQAHIRGSGRWVVTHLA